MQPISTFLVKLALNLSPEMKRRAVIYGWLMLGSLLINFSFISDSIRRRFRK